MFAPVDGECRLCAVRALANRNGYCSGSRDFQTDEMFVRLAKKVAYFTEIVDGMKTAAGQQSSRHFRGLARFTRRSPREDVWLLSAGKVPRVNRWLGTLRRKML
jgi:hypothetical protein